MRLKITLEHDEVNKGTAELELSDKDLRSDQVKVFDSIKVSWAAVRNDYLVRKYGGTYYLKKEKLKIA